MQVCDIYVLLARTLKRKARAQTMNVAGRFRYATLPGIADFYRWEVVQSIGAGLKVRTARPQTRPVMRVSIFKDMLPGFEKTLRIWGQSQCFCLLSTWLVLSEGSCQSNILAAACTSSHRHLCALCVLRGRAM